MTLSPFFTGDTTLSSFSNRDSTLNPFPNKTLNHSSSKGRLWVAYFLSFNMEPDFESLIQKVNFDLSICPKDMYVWMHENFEFLIVWMYACACLNAWNFDLIFFNMHVWMREILRMHLWMHEHLEKCTYKNAFWECIFFLLFLFFFL